MERLAVYSTGLMRLADEMRQLSGLEPRFSIATAHGCTAVGGWGHKPTATRARAAARRSSLPYIAFEDGFLRALKPGTGQRPVSMVMDRTGIYYDARQPSDLETLLQTEDFSATDLARAREVIAAIAAHGLSKYNHGSATLDDPAMEDGKPMVLVIDQTAGDESIAGGLADAASFTRMAEAAAAENPGARIVAKLHPETLAGSKRGYVEAAARRHGMHILARHLSPWSLFQLKPSVYTVSSQFGFEALMAGCQVTCFGVPFYAGWGLTRDRAPVPRRGRRRTIEEVAAAVYLRYCSYFDAWRRTPIDIMTAIDQLAFLRNVYLANSTPVVCYGVARWKRRAVTAMLDGPNGPPRFTGSLKRATAMARNSGAALAAWGSTAIRLRPRAEAESVAVIAIEDGFLRSAGLGAAFVQPLSLVFDRKGLYFDSTRPSDIEDLLAHGDFSTDVLERARALRQMIVARAITKYNITPKASEIPAIPEGRDVVLVPGQVADDAAVTIGRPSGFPPGDNVNAILLERVRQRHPRAFVIYKPHPDVEQLGRAGALASGDERHADHIAREASLDRLFAVASRVETYSSQAGFEALLRNIPVTTHGLPFYAGWGLTEDCADLARRNRKRSLDELVAAAVFLYPRYWDPHSGLQCPPEVAIGRIGERRGEERWFRNGIGMVLGRSLILARRARRHFAGGRDDS